MKKQKTNQPDASTLNEENIFEITDELTEGGDIIDNVFEPIYTERIESQLKECSADKIKAVVISSAEENPRLCSNLAVVLFNVVEEKFEKMPDIIISSELTLEQQKRWQNALEQVAVEGDFDSALIKVGSGESPKIDVTVSKVPTLVTLASKAHAKYLFSTMKGISKHLQQNILEHMNTCVEEDNKSAPIAQMKL